MSLLDDTRLLVRTYRHSDHPTCRRLFVEGLIGGKIADGDVGVDIDDIETAYLSHPDNHFWIAESPCPTTGDKEVVGMVGVKQKGDGTAEVRRLRVDERFRRRGIGSCLLERALAFCRERNYIRVILDTYMDRDPAVKLFEKFSFRHGRTRKLGEKDMLYFYLDLYGAPREQASSGDQWAG